MAKKIKKSYGVTKLDVVNAESSLGFKDLVDFEVPVKGMAIIADDKEGEEGEEKEYAYIFGMSGEVYGGNADSIRRSVSSLIDMESEGDLPEGLTVTVQSRQSGSGKTFFTLLARGE